MSHKDMKELASALGSARLSYLEVAVKPIHVVRISQVTSSMAARKLGAVLVQPGQLELGD